MVITSSDCSLAPSLSSSHCSPSDHFPVFTTLSINPSPLPPPTLHSFRQCHRIDISSFLINLNFYRLITHPFTPSWLHTIPLFPLYLINMHLSSQNSPDVSPHPTPGLILLSLLLDLLSAMLKTSGNTPTLLLTGPLLSVCNMYYNLIFTAKKHYCSNLVASSFDNPKGLWQTDSKLLYRKSSSPLPSSAPGTSISLVDSFASFFTDKISILCLSVPC